MTIAEDVEAAKELLQRRGYVVLKTKAYEAAQQRICRERDGLMWLAREYIDEARQLRKELNGIRARSSP